MIRTLEFFVSFQKTQDSKTNYVNNNKLRSKIKAALNFKKALKRTVIESIIIALNI